MIIFEDECVSCPPEMCCLCYSCPNKRVPHYICDKCDEEDKLYEFDGRHLCADCVLNELEEVEEQPTPVEEPAEEKHVRRTRRTRSIGANKK